MPEQPRQIRNPVARSPLLRKGGAHQESRTAARQSQRQSLRKEAEDWRLELGLEKKS